MAALAQAPASLYLPDGAVADGQYVGAVADPKLRLPWLVGALRQKQWQYVSLVTEHHLVALAVVQLRYVANCFVYAVDLRDPQRLWQTEALSPLGLAAHFATNSTQGQTTWRAGTTHVALTATADGWAVQLAALLQDGQGQKRRLHGSAQLVAGQPLSLVHRLPTGRAAYTRKDAGLRATMALQLGDDPIAGEALATSDWTQAHAQRVTRWNWASFVVRLADGRRLGSNLSALVYDDANGHGRENALWIDDAVHVLGGVRFSLPADPVTQPWHVQSATDGAVDLRFVPLGARRQNVNFGLISSQFVQPYGLFSGSVRVATEVIAVDGAIGVVEDHFAKW